MSSIPLQEKKQVANKKSWTVFRFLPANSLTIVKGSRPTGNFKFVHCELVSLHSIIIRKYLSSAKNTVQLVTPIVCSGHYYEEPFGKKYFSFFTCFFGQFELHFVQYII